MNNNNEKPYGIRVQMPKDDPLAAPHLLGDEWTGHRWFKSAEQRDHAFQEMARQPANYRKGDKPSISLTKIDPG